MAEPKSATLQPEYTLASGPRLKKAALIGLALADGLNEAKRRQDRRSQRPKPDPKEPAKG